MFLRFCLGVPKLPSLLLCMSSHFAFTIRDANPRLSQQQFYGYLSPAMNYPLPTVPMPVDNSRQVQWPYFPQPVEVQAPPQPFDTLVKVATQTLTDK